MASCARALDPAPAPARLGRFAIAARLDTEGWLDLGLDLLRTRGPQALTIDDLCKAAGLTKGAFYHRFKGTDGYRDALLERWHAVTTDHVIDRLAPAAASDDPEARRDALNVLVVNIDLALERSIRSWGVYDAAVQAAVNEADRRRIAAVAALKEPRDTEAETLAAATAEYTMYLGFVMLQEPDALMRMAEWGPRAVVQFDAGLTPGPLPPPPADD